MKDTGAFTMLCKVDHTLPIPLTAFWNPSFSPAQKVVNQPDRAFHAVLAAPVIVFHPVLSAEPMFPTYALKPLVSVFHQDVKNDAMAFHADLMPPEIAFHAVLSSEMSR